MDRTDGNALSEFGAAVRSLMISRGIKHARRLAEMLDAHGVGVSEGSLSGYLRGDHRCPSRVARGIAEVLSLSIEEKYRLAWAFSYGQHRRAA